MILKPTGHYSTNELTEGQFESGSQNRVYKNLLGITKKREMDQIELQELVRASGELFNNFSTKQQIITDDIKQMHKVWLDKIYLWAGEYRRVNLTKDGFTFAAANRIPRLMKEFEEHELKKYTPCCFDSLEEIISAIAIVHVELVLIHPFREGNGRIARLLSNIMALQAKLPALDFGGIKGKKRYEYFSAVRDGLDRNYQPMIRIFETVIQRTLKRFKCD